MPKATPTIHFLMAGFLFTILTGFLVGSVFYTIGVSVVLSILIGLGAGLFATAAIRVLG